MNMINGELFVNMLISASNNLENRKEEINKCNVFPVPDGDTGTNMSLTFSKASKEICLMHEDSVTAIWDKLASASLRGARGNSGVILSQFIRGIAKGLKEMEETDIPVFADALKEGTESAYRAVMKPTEGTILTVIRKIAEAMESLDEDDDILSLLEAVVTSGNQALMETPKLLPVLKKAGVVDAGGKGLMLIFEGMLYAVQNGQTVERIEHEAE